MICLIYFNCACFISSWQP